MFRFRAFALVLLLPGLLATAAPEEELLSNYTRHVWHVQDGLVDQVVQAIVQTSDHYLWIGTTKGLLRFDGRNFVPYTGPGAAALSHGVTTLLLDREGALEIGTEGGGLLRLRDGRVEKFGTANGLGNPIIRALIEDRSGQLWVGTDRGCYRGHQGHFQQVESPSLYPNLGVASLLEDSHGALWIGGSKLLRVTGGRIQEFVLPSQNGSMRIKALFEDARGTLWVGAVAGLFHQNARGQFEKIPGLDGAVRTFGRLPSGALWAGTVGEGIYLQSPGGFAHLKAPELLPSNTVLSQTADAEGNLWIGTQAGLLRLSRTGIHRLQLPQAFDSDSGTLMRDSDGTLWVCSSRLFRMVDGRLKPFRFTALPEVGIRTMLRERSGALWIGTAGRGAYRIAPDGHVAHYTSEIGTNYIRGFLEARNGGVWIATDGGIAFYRNGAVFNYHELPTAPHGIVLSLAEGAGGKLWVGTLHGLQVFRNGHYEETGLGNALRDEAIWALRVDESGALWIGTGAGLFRLKNNRLFQFPDLLGGASRAVYQMLGRGDLFWISGPTRAARFHRTALDQAADRFSSEIPPHDLFFVSGGWPAAELYGGMQPAGVLDADGSAWYPSSIGPIHLLASERPAHTTMPLAIEQVLVDGRPTSTLSPLVLPPGTKTLEILYAPVLLGSQMGLNFRQRMEGFDSWGKLTLAHSAIYTNLPAGRHVFHVQALSPDASGPIAEATLVVLQRATFYHRPWFWLLCSAVFLAAGFGMFRLRVHQIKVRLRAIADERNRLAREMHDTLLQGCIGVSTLLEACASPGSTGDARGQLLDCARSQISELIGQTRDAMWNLRGHELEQCDFALCARKLLDQHVHPSGIAASFAYQGPPLELDYRIAYELLMSMREALLNAVAHSHGSEIALSLFYSESELSITVCDNGQGFLIGSEAEKQTGAHYGLQGMRERIRNIGGRCIITSAPDSGTRVSIAVPRAALEHCPAKKLEM